VLRRVSARTLLIAALCGLSVPAISGAAQRSPRIDWHDSRSLGLPWHGRLVHGVQLPAEGRRFFTWDPALKRSPDRGWRRWGNDRLVRVVLDVIGSYVAAHPAAPRVGIGDLSRPHGGDFGEQYGGLGHDSHQNGLDADIYYPRKDRREAAPRTPAQVDQLLAQDLVDRFVDAGARYVFVGPHLRLHGPRSVVTPLVHHDNHLHVRIPNPVAPRQTVLGRSVQGRPVRAVRLGDPASRRRVLVIGCIHGDECAGTAIARRLIRADPLLAADVWVIPDLNPDGRARASRQNANGIDLNRNFPGGWRAIGSAGDAEYSGPHPLSEPETRIAARLIRRVRPAVTIWFHQPQGIVRAWGRSTRAGRRYARLAGMRFRELPWRPGSGPNWQNRAFRRGASFVVELPPGPVSAAATVRHVRAIVGVATQ
jgi:Zinc carboxypeptidase/Penicillin-insensitive murein endopeptidase